VSRLLRAEWIRFRRRSSIQVIVLAVPLLAAFMFLSGSASVGPEPPAFDPVAVRAELLAQGYGQGLPPDQLEQALNDAVEAQRVPVELALEQYRLARSAFAFPQGIVTLISSGTLVLLGVLLLTATSLGDEFGWGTIRTVLLASNHRARILLLRLGMLFGIGAALLAVLGLLGVVLPLVVSALGAPAVDVPPLHLGALGVLVLGTLEATFMVLAFGAMVTVLVRSGSLTLVLLLVYVALEASVLTVLLRFAPFQEGGGLVWLLDAFPLRGFTRLTGVAGQMAAGLPHFPGEVVPTDLSSTFVSLVAFLVWGGLFLAIAYRRFTRMDIVE
jgi:ABC-type transport system involved in multi-copper enzyme maturation permease subunit